jgi:hypothetical protein
VRKRRRRSKSFSYFKGGKLMANAWEKYMTQKRPATWGMGASPATRSLLPNTQPYKPTALPFTPGKAGAPTQLPYNASYGMTGAKPVGSGHSYGMTSSQPSGFQNSLNNAYGAMQQQPRTFYGNASDIALARASGLQGNFIDISTYGQDSIIKDIQHSFKTGGNPMVLGGAGATKGISDQLLALINQNGTKVGRIGGKDRYEVQENLKRYMTEQDTKIPDWDKLRIEGATIDDIARKYGIDYSRDYAKRQAEAEAQARRDAVDSQKRQNSTSKEEMLAMIENNLKGATQSLDQNYFLEGLNQSQEQVNNGLNAGIAADQNLRLAMNRQGEMADIQRDASLGRMQEQNRFTNKELDLLAEMGLINKESLAREDSIYNERLQQGLENAMNLTQMERDQLNQMIQQRMGQRGQDLDRQTALDQMIQDQKQFDTRLKEEGRQFDLDQNNRMSQAYQQLQEEKRQFNDEAAWRKHTFNNMSAQERAQFNIEKQKWGEELAWRKYELEYSSNINLQIAQAQSGF